MISERMTVMVTVFVVLLAALVVTPVAAGRVVNPGDVVYVGEENIKFSDAFGPTAVTHLVHYSDPTVGIVDLVFLTDAAGNLYEIKSSIIGTTTGTYYAFNTSGDVANRSTAAGYVNIQYPEVSLGVVLNTSHKDSVAGKSVSRDTVLDFELSDNIIITPNPTIRIEVTMPGGGTTTQFGGLDLSAVGVTGGTRYIGPVDLSGYEAGTYTAIAKWPSDSDFYGKGYNSNTVTFEVTTKKLAITSNKDSVVHGKSFSVTVTGESQAPYILFVKKVGSLTSDSDYPLIAPGQPGVSNVTKDEVDNFSFAGTNISATVAKDIAKDIPGLNYTQAWIKTTAGGTRTVQFNTSSTIDNWQFTIRVQHLIDPTNYDEVKVWVEKGVVTITAVGTGIYYIGEEITLEGTSTEGDSVYLFLTGPGLPTNGAALMDVTAPVEDGNPVSFTETCVEAEDTWSYRWGTAGVSGPLDAGGYTIYAVSTPRDKSHLSEAQYDAISIQIRNPTLTARVSGTTVVRGEDYQITGIATGDPDCVAIWIIGPEYRVMGVPVRVEADGSFRYTFTGAETTALTNGQYYVVIQHPTTTGFEVVAEGETISGPGISPVNLARLRAFEAATALTNALASPNVDDIYVKLTFVVSDSWISIDGIGKQIYGEKFTVTGKTSYPAGTELTYRIVAKEGGVAVLHGETVVTDDGDWGFDLDTTLIGAGVFTIQVTSPDGQVSATAIFEVYDDLLHPVTPPGATYNIVRLQLNPPLDELVSGGDITLIGTIGAPSRNQGSIEFFTELDEPVWSYSLERDGVVIYSASRASRSFSLSAFELDYTGDVRILLSLGGMVPQTIDDKVLLRILERDWSGTVVPESEYSLAFQSSSGGTNVLLAGLTLQPGWNFISITRPLATGNNTALIFADVETEGHSVLRYDTTNSEWVALGATDLINPLEGFWVYSRGTTFIALNFSTDPLIPPAERVLAPGWNAIGITGTTPVTARDALLSVSGKWTTLIGFDAGKQAFETGIISGGSRDYTDSRLVYQGKGYWLYMIKPGTLCAIGA